LIINIIACKDQRENDQIIDKVIYRTSVNTNPHLFQQFDVIFIFMVTVARYVTVIIIGYSAFGVGEIVPNTRSST